MSMYNLMFGENGMGAAILSTLGLTKADTGRYRDCFIADGEIAVYTRNGGGNREEYQSVVDELARHPCYLRDEDDDFDRTYTTIYFKFPDEFSNELKALDSGVKFNPLKRWMSKLESLKTSSK